MGLNEIKTILRSRIKHNDEIIAGIKNSLQFAGIRKLVEGENTGIKFALSLLADVEA